MNQNYDYSDGKKANDSLYEESEIVMNTMTQEEFNEIPCSDAYLETQRLKAIKKLEKEEVKKEKHIYIPLDEKQIAKVKSYLLTEEQRLVNQLEYEKEYGIREKEYKPSVYEPCLYATRTIEERVKELKEVDIDRAKFNKLDRIRVDEEDNDISDDEDDEIKLTEEEIKKCRLREEEEEIEIEDLTKQIKIANDRVENYYKNKAKKEEYLAIEEEIKQREIDHIKFENYCKNEAKKDEYLAIQKSINYRKIEEKLKSCHPIYSSKR